MAESVVFEIDGREFTYTKLPLTDQMRLWPKCARDLGPILSKLNLKGLGDETTTDISFFGPLLSEAVSFLEHIEEYLAVFAKQTDIQWQMGADESTCKTMKLAALQKHVFTKSPQILKFVVKCFTLEFADFLPALLGEGLLAPDVTATRS